MAHTERLSGALRAGAAGAILVIVGVVLSGPLGLIAVNAIHAQPAWHGARTFAENFHSVQTAPFFAGIALVLGFVVVMAALYHLASERQKPRMLVAALLTGVFATLIFFNYISQTTFIPALVRDYRPEHDTLIAVFSFSNPRSLCWAIEMWGYALLGVATWVAVPVFDRQGIERSVRLLMTINGIFSIAGALVVSYDLSWVFTPAGLFGYAVWNMLIVALAVCMLASFRQRRTMEEVR
jgi:Ni/Fe-hydrogenase subunit HybB-like protein